SDTRRLASGSSGSSSVEDDPVAGESELLSIGSASLFSANGDFSPLSATSSSSSSPSGFPELGIQASPRLRLWAASLIRRRHSELACSWASKAINSSAVMGGYDGGS